MATNLKERKTTRKIHRTPLRTIREATGFSQIQFAEKVGTNPATIENIEMGRSTMASDLAMKIASFTGAHLGSLLNYDFPTKMGLGWTSNQSFVADAAGQPYSKESFQKWRSAEISLTDYQFLGMNMQEHLVTLVKASRSRSTGEQTPHSLRRLLCSFSNWLNSEIEELGLAQRMNEIFMEESSASKGEEECTVGMMRIVFGEHPIWQSHDDPAWPNEMPVKVTKIEFPKVAPLADYIMLEGKTVFIAQGIWRHQDQVSVGGKRFALTFDLPELRHIGGDESLKETIDLLLKPRFSSRNDFRPPPSEPPSPTPAPLVESPKTSRPRRGGPAAGKQKK